MRRRLRVPAAVVNNSNIYSGAPYSCGFVLGEAAGGAEHVSAHHDTRLSPPIRKGLSAATAPGSDSNG